MEVEVGMGRRAGAAGRRGALVALEASGEVEVEAEEVEAGEGGEEGQQAHRRRQPGQLSTTRLPRSPQRCSPTRTRAATGSAATPARRRRTACSSWRRTFSLRAT